VPTDSGFRLYLDDLLEREEPPEVDKELLEKSCAAGSGTVEGLLMETARALSTLTDCAGLMFVLKKDLFVIKHISILPMDATSVLVVIVSSLGMVHSRQIRLGEDAGGLNLERITNYLNTLAKGRTIRGLRSKIVEEMKKEKSLYDRLLNNALRLGVMAFESPEEDSDLYLEGRVKMFEQPEFKDDFDRMRKIFSAFEEKSLMVRLLDKSVEDDGIHITLGSEGGTDEFDGLSFVTAPYGGSGVLGSLGVVGPVRMNYSRIIPLVEYTARLLSKSFV
jgi:heat-inducible transcriptional repressor